jgi:hypothetical protein
MVRGENSLATRLIAASVGLLAPTEAVARDWVLASGRLR